MVVFANFPIILNGILKTTIPLDKEGASEGRGARCGRNDRFGILIIIGFCRSKFLKFLDSRR